MVENIAGAITQVGREKAVDIILAAAGWPVGTDGRHQEARRIADCLFAQWADASSPVVSRAVRMWLRANTSRRQPSTLAEYSELAYDAARHGVLVRNRIMRRLGRKFMPKYTEFCHG